MLMKEHPGVRPGEDLEFDEVLDAARRGDSYACRQIYEALAGRVCGYLRTHGVSDPEDLTSEVFLRVFGRLHRFSGGEPQFRSWVFTIAHRISIDERRRCAARVSTSELTRNALDHVAGGDVEKEAFDHLRGDWVDEVLTHLSPDQRSVVSLRVIGDLSVEQVARVLGKPAGAVKALQRRGLATLRREMDGTRELEGMEAP